MFKDMQHVSVTTGATIWMLAQKALRPVVERAVGVKILGIVGKQKKTILSLQRSAKKLIKQTHSKK